MTKKITTAKQDDLSPIASVARILADSEWSIEHIIESLSSCDIDDEELVCSIIEAGWSIDVLIRALKDSGWFET